MFKLECTELFIWCTRSAKTCPCILCTPWLCCPYFCLVDHPQAGCWKATISRLGMMVTWRARRWSPLFYILRSRQEVPKCPSKGLLFPLMQLPGQELPKGDLVWDWDVHGMPWMRQALSLLLEGAVGRLNRHFGTFCLFFFGCKVVDWARGMLWFVHSHSSALQFHSEQLLGTNRKTCNIKRTMHTPLEPPPLQDFPGAGDPVPVVAELTRSSTHGPDDL